MNNDMTRYDEMTGGEPARSRHLAGNIPTTCQNRSDKPSATSKLMSTLLLLLLMVLGGAVEAWGQTDYSGVYYLSGNNQGTNSYNVDNTTTNYYLCPTENWIFYQATDNFTTSDNGQPFLTTYQYRNGTYDHTKAVWVIVKHPTQNNYYIIHAKDGKYMTANGGITGSKSANRIRVHLEESNSPNDNMLFGITYITTISTTEPKNNTPYYDISPQNYNGWYLNITQGNRELLQGTSAKADGPEYTLNGSTTRNVGGTIGLWNQGNDYTSKWYFEDAKAALTPAISDINAANNTFTITSAFVPTGCSIVYTTDGSDPSTSNGTTYSGAVPVTESMTVKAAVVGYGMVLSNIDSKSLSPVVVAPTVTNNGDGTISLSTLTSGATIYYTTDGNDPDNNSNPYNNTPFTLGNATVIKAIAYLGSEHSEVTTYNVPNYTTPTISFNSATSQVTITSEGTIYYNTGDGSQADPTTSSTAYSTPFTVSSATTVKAIATHAGYLTSEVATLAITQVATPTIQNNGSNAISITCATPDATIYYTTDGSTPTTGNTQYAAPLTDNVSGVTIKAIAVKENMIPSAVGSGSVTLQCATPVITRDGMTFSISCSMPTDASLYYSLDGTTPATLYSGPVSFTIDQLPLTVTAVAKHANYTDSESATFELINGSGTASDPYLIYGDTDFANFISNVNNGTTSSACYKLETDVSASNTSAITTAFTGTFDGNFHTINDLDHPLFNTVNGGTVKNVILKDVQISQDGPVGAIAGTASGYTRIYNCGILPSDNKFAALTQSSVKSSDGYCGGLVGWLKDDSRVINCFSYANITGGTDVAGIVGHNEAVYTNSGTGYGSTTQTNNGKYYRLKTAVVNCMFYGNITSGTNRWPVYGGAMMRNDTDNGINNYDFYRAEASLGLADDSHYNCSWPAKEEYLTQYEFHRYLLNSNRELCGWWVGAPSAPSGMSTSDVQAVAKDASLMAKWVLDPSIAPYPILKTAGKYPSVINQAPRPGETNPQRIDSETKQWGSRATASTEWTNPKAAPETEGQTLGSISVTIQDGDEHDATDITRTFTITAMDIENNDFCYGKIQLPYYNSIFGDPSVEVDPNESLANRQVQWNSRFGGNYNDKVVVGWTITSVTGGVATITNVKKEENNVVVFDHTFSTDAESGYNFADRYCTTKDEERVFAQGGYYYVPYGVTNITIKAKWATAIYLDNSANHDYDCVRMSSATCGQRFLPAGTRPTTLANGQSIVTGTIQDNIPSDGSVYENAIVLVGNHQYRAGGSHIRKSDSDNTSGCTIMSADFDLDEEPDYCLIWQLGNATSRYHICPIRFDFLPVVEIGLAMKQNASTQYYSLGCYRPLGHFEVTETSLIRFGQFEFGNSSRESSAIAPLILNGGIFEQYVKGTEANGADKDYINYIIIGGNVRIPSFTPGAHVKNTANKSTRHCPLNVIGGNIDYLYLTGNYNENVTPNADNPHCYIDGGNFEHIAAAGKEGINGDVYFSINHSVIQEFYGGSTMDKADGAFKIVKGNIDVTIDNSMVTKYCGGPKFGDMVSGKTVTTHATGTTFGVYYGGGNGGTSYVQYSSTDVTVADVTNGNYNWTSTSGDNGKLDSYTAGTYRSGDGNKNYMADYDMEIVNTSTGTDSKKAVFRTYFYAAQFSKTDTGPITNSLTDCIVLTNFYGGGNLGGVNGNVTSTLAGSTHVIGSAFGAGFSASAPQVTIQNKNKDYPEINIYTGIITPQSDGTSTTYTWTDKSTINGTGLSTGSPIAEDTDGTKYFFTEKSLNNLGAVSGAVTLTIKDNSIIDNNVYGGGDASAVSNTTTPANASTTVNLQGNAHVFGNVFGGGNEGLVSGSTTVNIGETPAP